MSDDKIEFEQTLTGYDDKPTRFYISRKHQGTAPNITVYQRGKYTGEITLSERAAKELARNLIHICGDSK